MELYVLRHGTTDWNKRHLLQGDSDIPLDEEGIRLAEEVGEALKDTRFDLCYSSPLKRAYQTAELVLGGRGLSIIKEPRIQEMNFGDYEGKNVSQTTSTLDPAFLKAMAGDGDMIHHYPVPPHGETVEHILKRTHEFYEELISNPENEEKRILISTHGAAGRALMHSVWGGSFWHGTIPPNCSICIVSVEHQQVKNVREDVVLYKSAPVDWYK